ncbi:ubiquitin carboxyl-terminal hydrolase 43 isoform X2 [Pipistrellus kuhlii]|uniref:ubiquitinyl hydrolase 1 n=1 Tax=Pipistrellus kuhlii TaxID=59472 RepID=A0A7J7TY68_PIPKU|nr:ubiquitin carboxyl-terminal hydrolase 43 isoform X2 [Pipistrellus kuhlii]KAF6305589.1 ubiquitin specific peptidase 43 [Pipistrellus kuhlii]
MEPGPGGAAAEGPPALRPRRRRRSLRRLFSRFLLALGSRSRPEDSPPRSDPQPQPRPCDGDGEGGFACAPDPAPVPAAPGSPEEERAPGPLSPLPAGDGARPPGALGLKNHGNTCFMNAVVQCLSNTDLLAEFLALGRYRAAPGRAEVTGHLAALVRALWTREYTPQLSAEFKNAVSRYGAQFQGHAQHDALEFLLWLLDRVHEDSEGSSRGPGSPQLQPEGSNTPENHLPPSAPHSPGQSFVQSHFQAQYRSSLTCPHCLKQSNTFDPFLCVSLPIPLRQTRFLSVTLAFPSQSQRFLRVGLAVPILSTVAALRKMVAQEGNVPVDEVILVELGPSGLQRSFFDEDDLNTIAEGDNVYAFHAPPPPGQEALAAPPPGLSVSPRLAAHAGQRLTLPAHRENKVLILCCNLVGSGQQASRFGPPFLIREDRTISWVQLQQSILSKVRHLMKGEAPGQQNPGPLFSIRVVGQSLALSYLSPQDSRPLCHWAVDRALHPRRPGGPPHIKLAVEWDSCAKERLFGSPPEVHVRDADSVWQQQQAHQQHSCTLDECFQFYTKEEQLAQDDAWKCPHCQALQQGVVKLSLWTLPDILIVHLKRFCQVGGRRNKLSTLVKFPLCGLDMAPHVAQRGAGAVPAPGPWPTWKQPACLPTSYPPDFLYDLYAVCNHHGSLQAYCRNSLDGQWYSYDDSTVEPLPEAEVITRGAYILFYQKQNSIPCWSASSSMRGSTSSSLSDHWLLRLGSSPSSPRGSLSSWRSAPSPAQPRAPAPLVFTDHHSSQEKGGLESRPMARGERGRSISMKVPAPSRARQGPFGTMPLRWSFGHRDKPVVASVELVEYLESRRRPRSTSQSIVPLLMGAAGGDERSAVPRSNATPSAKGEGSEQRASERGPAGVSCPEGHPGAADGLDGLETAGKPEARAGHDIRLPKQFEVLLTATPAVHGETGARPEGQRTASGRGSGRVGTRDASSAVGTSAPQNAFARARANAEGRDPEPDRLSQGTLTLLRSMFLKKKNKRNDRAEAAPQVAPASLGSGRLSPAGGEQTRGSSSLRRVPGGMARGPEGAVRSAPSSAPSSLHLPRKACRPPRAGAPSTAQRGVPGEHAPFGSLQRVKYHTLSLRRKKTLPESSF